MPVRVTMHVHDLQMIGDAMLSRLRQQSLYNEGFW